MYFLIWSPARPSKRLLGGRSDTPLSLSNASRSDFGVIAMKITWCKAIGIIAHALRQNTQNCVPSASELEGKQANNGFQCLQACKNKPDSFENRLGIFRT